MKTKWNMYQLAMVCSDLYKELKNFCYYPSLMILICKYKHNIGNQTKHGNWPNKSIAIAIEILAQKCIAIVIMHYFF